MECGILFTNDGIGPKDEHGCHLKVGHTEPHEFVSSSGFYAGTTFRWETDLECDCEHCMREGGDFCIVYWVHSKAAATCRAIVRTAAEIGKAKEG